LVTAGTLAVNGRITSNVTVGPAGTLSGNGIITGSVANAGTLAPGNSIGLLTVNGTYTQMAGSTYQVEVNNAGQG
jgi:fibronectin-binding autotransporter adhesin